MSRFRNHVKFLFEDLRVLNVVGSCFEVQKGQGSIIEGKRFWEIKNLMYDIEGKSFMIRPEVIENCHMIKEDSKGLSVLRRSQEN